MHFFERQQAHAMTYYLPSRAGVVPTKPSYSPDRITLSSLHPFRTTTSNYNNLKLCLWLRSGSSPASPMSCYVNLCKQLKQQI